MIRRDRLRERELLEIGAVGDGPAPPGRAASVVRGTTGGVAALGCILLLSLYALPGGSPSPDDDPLATILARAEPTLVAPPAQWRAVEPPRITLGLDAPRFAGLPSRHVARIGLDGAREDTLVFGAFDGPDTHLLLGLSRPGAASAPASSFFLDMARSAARAGLAVARIEQASGVETRLGPLEVASLVLESGPVRACLGFRGGTPALALSGWLCDPAAGGVELACLIEGLTLLEDGGEADLAGAFAAARARDPACPLRGEVERVAAIGAPAVDAPGSGPLAPPTPPRRPDGS